MRPALRSAGALLLACALPCTAAAQAPPPAAKAPSRDFAVRCGKLYIEPTASFADAWLVVRDGKVASWGKDAPPPELPVVDYGQRVVMPGIVAVDSDLAGARDDEYAITPDFQAVDGFDFEAPLTSALQGGVTTVYLSPGRERLVSGQGAVIKTSGTDLVQRVLSDSACLRVNFDDGGVNAPRVFEPTAHPTDEDPLLPARVQTPTARIGVLPELRALFAAAPGEHGLVGEGKGENRYDPAALQAVIGGTLTLRAGAWKATDIRRALQLQQELGLHMVLENPQDIAQLAAQAATQKVAATFRMPVLLGRPNPGTEDRLADVRDVRFDAPARAAAAGMTIGLAPALGMSLRDYLVAVGLAVRGGLDAQVALRAIGDQAAAILGVGNRVGTLGKGKDADFVVLSGEPLAIGTMVEATWVDGRLAYERKGEGHLLAVRCGKILDGEGRVHRNGTLIVQGSRIKAVGEDLSIPYGARVIDLPGAVMTPGFVDAWSNLGLAGEGTGVPQGAPNVTLENLIAFDDPMFAQAIAAGVTTVLTSGKDGGPIAGRVAAVKTGARDQQGLVLAKIAGQRAAFDAIGPDADKPLRDAIARARQYAEQWSAYEKALAEWKAGKKPAAAPAPAPPPAPSPPAGAPAAADPVSGTWEGQFDVQGRFSIKFILHLRLEGTKVTGTARLTLGTRELPEQEITNGTFDAGKLRAEFRSMGGNAVLEGTVKDDAFDGKISLGPQGDQPLTMKRTAKGGETPPASAPAQASSGAKSDEPKKPAVDEGQEPMRAVIEKRAALVVRVNRGPAIAAVIALLEKEQLPYVLQDADGALDDHSVFGGRRPPVLLDPELVRDDGRKVIDKAAEFADLDLPLLFGSGDCTGARFLPLHAAYAVRYGLSPDDALAGLTVNPARAFKLDDRIGSLKKGKDADFVVFSGDPFEPQSRILLVACNGELAVDRREEGK
jgi:imidazolonepropionase-like amidohydrolase